MKARIKEMQCPHCRETFAHESVIEDWRRVHNEKVDVKDNQRLKEALCKIREKTQTDSAGEVELRARAFSVYRIASEVLDE